MPISIQSVLVEPLEILFAEAGDTLAPQAGDLTVEDLLRPLHLMYVFKKLIYPEPSSDTLSFLLNLTRFGLCEFALESPLGFKTSLAHFDRQVVTIGEPMPVAFLLPSWPCP